MKNRRSIKQVYELEWKLVLWIVGFMMIIPFILLCNTLLTINVIGNMGILDQVNLLLGKSSLDTVNLSWLVNLGSILSVVVTPWIAYTIARKLEGDRLLFSIKNATKAIKTKRFWNFIIKIYVPIFALIFVAQLLFSKFVDMTNLINFVFTVTDNKFALILSILIVAIILTILLALAIYVMVANVVYYRGASRIKAAFSTIPPREFKKMLLIQIPYLVAAGIAGIIFYVQLSNLSLLTIVSGLLSAVSTFLVLLFLIDLIFSFIKVGLVINSASKTEIK